VVADTTTGFRDQEFVRGGYPQITMSGCWRRPPATTMTGVIEELLERQDGVLTRSQALEAGLTPAAIKARLASGRWQRLRTGVYAAFSGPVPRTSELWAAVLAAGPNAVLSHESAAEVVGLADRPPAIHLTVPGHRKVKRVAGIVIHRSSRVERARHPVLRPPQTRIEETVIDLTQTAPSLQDAYGVVTRAVNARLTTAERLLSALDERPKLRWRRLLRQALGDVAAGCRSVLELAYLRDVERAHRLPPGHRQYPVARAGGRLYIDVRYRGFGTRVELDGRAAHPAHARFRDLDRDNAAVEAGDRALRYGTPDVTSRPCAVARQVANVLRAAGWTGYGQRCSRPDCVLP
jgi:Transcriptional regulator, AbiEi antitoxin